MNTIKIFGYGSLINENSLKKTCSNAKILYPAKLYGFVRVFNIPSAIRFCSLANKPCAALNAEKSEWNEYINGVCIEIPKTDFQKLLEREKGYELVQVDIEHFVEEKTQRVFMFRSLHFESYDYIWNSIEQKEYLQICEEGCKKFGEEFLREFRKTTFIGTSTLENINL